MDYINIKLYQFYITLRIEFPKEIFRFDTVNINGVTYNKDFINNIKKLKMYDNLIFTIDTQEYSNGEITWLLHTKHDIKTLNDNNFVFDIYKDIYNTYINNENIDAIYQITQDGFVIESVDLSLIYDISLSLINKFDYTVIGKKHIFILK